MIIKNIAPAEIERESFRIIGEELRARGISLPPANEKVIMRCIHTTADFDYASTLQFSGNAVERACEILRGGADIVTDTNMAAAGINRVRLSEYGGSVHCLMADDGVAAEAKKRGVTRAAVSMERAAELFGSAVFCVGNAPTALIKLRELMDGGYQPAFVIGVPVGFVNVEAAKELILESGADYIVNGGRKGGSTVAAAIVNALLYSL